jgi:hypothetical protein
MHPTGQTACQHTQRSPDATRMTCTDAYPHVLGVKGVDHFYWPSGSNYSSAASESKARRSVSGIGLPSSSLS